MTSIKPSPALTLSEHTSIGDTIQFLTTHQVGSVIITAYDDPDRPVGIFSERDLLKWALQLGSNSQWNTAIGHIMTKSLITITIEQLNKANELMIQHHIRHLPVVYSDDDQVLRLAGIVSMRDAFKRLVEENQSIRELMAEIELKPSITVLAKNGSSRKLQSSLLGNRAHIQFLPENSSGKDVLNHLKQSQAFVFDIDSYQNAEWVAILKTVLDSGTHPDVHMIMDPKQHDQVTTKTLQTMHSAHVLNVFYKPINLIAYLERIDASLVNSDQINGASQS
jgi:CBS domain-containing protein